MTISFKVSDETKEKLKEFYEDLKRDKTPDYATFQAQDGDTVVTLYDSGKIVFQGRDADLASDFWVATEKMINPRVKIQNSEKKEKDKVKDFLVDPKIYYSTSIGSDEVGTGAYFGPIVVTGAFVKKEDIPFLETLGITDSKKMTDEKILEVVPLLTKKIPYTSFILKNEQYNTWSHQMNMNKIKAVLHNKVLLELSSKYSADYIVVDEFAKPSTYYSYLKEVPNVVKNITFLTKGEVKCLSVACASVISRYIFLKEFEKLEQELHTILPKGAGPDADLKAVEIVKKNGFQALEKIVKLNFKNTEKVKQELTEN